jgi:hypothetical protein
MLVEVHLEAYEIMLHYYYYYYLQPAHNMIIGLLRHDCLLEPLLGNVEFTFQVIEVVADFVILRVQLLLDNFRLLVLIFQPLNVLLFDERLSAVIVVLLPQGSQVVVHFFDFVEDLAEII